MPRCLRSLYENSAIVLALLLSVVPLHAQSSNWTRLEALPEGTELIVHTRRDLRCTLNYIDAGGIECVSPFSLFRIDRSHVIAVSLRRSQRIVGIGTLVGAAAGAGTYGRNGDPIAAAAGAVVGGFGGWVVGHAIRLSPGRTIYLRP